MHCLVHYHVSIAEQSQQDLVKHTIVVTVVSTTGQGEFPQNARSFRRVLLSRRLKPGLLRRVNFTSFGLGDSSYPRFNIAHRMLHGRMLQLGAQLFCQRGEGNEQHPEGHIGGFRSWIMDLKASLIQHFPLPVEQEMISDDHFLEPKWKLDLANTQTNRSRQSHQSAVEEAHANDVLVDTPPGDLLPITDGLIADLTANPRITPVDHHQDVRLLNLTLDHPVEYGAGAVAVIHPKNFPEDVDHFINYMDWQSIADVPLQLVPSQPNVDPKSLPPSPLRHVDLSQGTITMRVLLTNYIDIMSIPRRSFFASLAYFAKEGNEDEAYQKERILELANPELIDELWDYTTRPRRTILEVIPDFPSIKIPWQYALSILPTMRGRQFSIASGGALKQTPSGKGQIQLLVAIANPPNPIIKYRKRYGVCTRYIATLQAGQKLTIGLQPGYLNVTPEEALAPVLMIGPGTGVAPMRSMIYERLAWNQQNNSKDVLDTNKPLDGTVLFFGCRNQAADYFFAEEWTQLQEQGLKVFTGFSRDTDTPKTYVQDLLRAQSALVWDILDQRAGKVYVCGSSGNMPKGVRQALVEVLQEHGELGEEDAEAYLDAMEKAGRYKQETW